MKTFFIAGNWKMNTTLSEAKELAEFIVKTFPPIPENIKVILCPPFINIPLVSRIVKQSFQPNIFVGAQNCHFENKGAFTGEVSAPMLIPYDCRYVIIGHSERRKYFNEDNSLINKKLIAVHNNNLIPIFCIGETLEERQQNKTLEILKSQIEEGLEKLSNEQIEKTLIAYEPVWAIGTGISATTEQIFEAHNFIKDLINDNYKIDKEKIFILYGGSVDDKNSYEILKLENVNGALIGGASLKKDVFKHIYQNAIELS